LVFVGLLYSIRSIIGGRWGVRAKRSLKGGAARTCSRPWATHPAHADSLQHRRQRQVSPLDRALDADLGHIHTSVHTCAARNHTPTYTSDAQMSPLDCAVDAGCGCECRCECGRGGGAAPLLFSGGAEHCGHPVFPARAELAIHGKDHVGGLHIALTACLRGQV
jgi:hypothetical protein